MPEFNHNGLRLMLKGSQLITLHPPKPRLVVRVGITGHRLNKLNGLAAERIESQLPLLFAAINKPAQEILLANSAWYSDEPPTVRLVSSFAEGADQMAVAASPASWQVEAVLPFPMDEYLNDFGDVVPGDDPSPRDMFLRCIKRASTVTQLPFTPNAFCMGSNLVGRDTTIALLGSARQIRHSCLR